MLRLADEERIAEHFAADNRMMLTKFCGLSGAESERFYEEYFRPSGDGRAYADVGEIEMINRGLGILLETLLDRLRPEADRPPALLENSDAACKTPDANSDKRRPGRHRGFGTGDKNKGAGPCGSNPFSDETCPPGRWL